MPTISEEDFTRYFVGMPKVELLGDTEITHEPTTAPKKTEESEQPPPREYEAGQKIVAKDVVQYLQPGLYKADLEGGEQIFLANVEEGEPFKKTSDISLVVVRVRRWHTGEIFHFVREEDATSNQAEIVNNENENLKVGDKIEAEFRSYSGDNCVVVWVDNCGYKLEFEDGVPIELQEGKKYRFEIQSTDGLSKYIVRAKFLGEVETAGRKSAELTDEDRRMVERQFEPGAVWVFNDKTIKNAGGQGGMVINDVRLLDESGRGISGQNEIICNPSWHFKVVDFSLEKGSPVFEIVETKQRVEFILYDDDIYTDEGRQRVISGVKAILDNIEPQIVSQIESDENRVMMGALVEEIITGKISNAYRRAMSEYEESSRYAKGFGDRKELLEKNPRPSDEQPVGGLEGEEEKNLSIPERFFERRAVWVMRPIESGKETPSVQYSVVDGERKLPQEINWRPNGSWHYYIERADFKNKFIDFHAKETNSAIMRVSVGDFVSILRPSEIAQIRDESEKNKAEEALKTYVFEQEKNSMGIIPDGDKVVVGPDRSRGVKDADELEQKSLNDPAVDASRGLPAHKERGDEKTDKAVVPERPAVNGEIFERRGKIRAESLKPGDQLLISPDRNGSYDDGRGHLKPTRDLAKENHTYKFASFEDGIVEVEVDDETLISMPQAVFENNFKASRELVEDIAQSSAREGVEHDRVVSDEDKKIAKELDDNIWETKQTRNKDENGASLTDEKAYTQKPDNATASNELRSTETSFDRREDDNSSVVNRSETMGSSLKIEKNGEIVDIKPGQTWMWMWTPSDENPEKRMPIKLNIADVNQFSNDTASIQFKGKESINRPISEWEAIFESAALTKE